MAPQTSSKYTLKEYLEPESQAVFYMDGNEMMEKQPFLHVKIWESSSNWNNYLWMDVLDSRSIGFFHLDLPNSLL